MKILAVASACETLDGPFVAVELARAMASARQRILFVDCDWNTRATRRLVGNRPGSRGSIRELLLQEAELAQTIVSVNQVTVSDTGAALRTETISVIPAQGTTRLKPQELLGLAGQATSAVLDSFPDRLDVALFQLDGFTSPLAHAILREAGQAAVLIPANHHAGQVAKATAEAIVRAEFKGRATGFLTGTAEGPELTAARAALKEVERDIFAVGGASLRLRLGSALPGQADPQTQADIAAIAKQLR